MIISINNLITIIVSKNIIIYYNKKIDLVLKVYLKLKKTKKLERCLLPTNDFLYGLKFHFLDKLKTGNMLLIWLLVHYLCMH